MKVRNFSTNVSVERSIAEIEKILSELSGVRQQKA
jgi:hypothetical protein